MSKNDDHYQLGSVVSELVAPAQGGLTKDLRRVITPVLTALHEKTHYLVGLGIPRIQTVEFVDTIYGYEYSRLIKQIEESSALHTSAAGKVLLAYDPDLSMSFAARAGWRSPDAGPLGLPPELEAELSEIRRRGVAVSTGGSRLGIAAMAVPVFGMGNRPLAALSMGAYLGRFDMSCALGLLRQSGVDARRILAAVRASACG